MKHVVEQGECLSSISARHHLNWETVWNHSENAAIKAKRKNPNVLQSGDVLYIPEIEPKSVSGATGQKHRFVLRSSLTSLKIRLIVNDEPRANLPFTLYVDDALIAQGTTDGDGFLSAEIPAAAGDGRLEVTEAGVVDLYYLQLGEIDPIDTESGVRQRLHNLGHAVKEDLRAGVREFQTKMKLPVTGDIDSSTRSKLQQKYGQ